MKALYALLAVATTMLPPASQAAYPERPITLVVPYAAGGMGSTFGNVVGDALARQLGRPVVVDYRPGANGALGAAYVAKAQPDGYTMLMAVNSTMAINPNLYPKLQYDPVGDFAPVAMVNASSNILVVNAASPFKSLQELIDYARQNPGKLNFGSSGNGATPHLSGEMLKRLADVKINHVPYKGIGPAVTDLLGGQIDFVFSDTSAMPQVQAGRLRALAVTGPTRLGIAPDIPTMQEAGLDDFIVRTWYSLVVPAGTPEDVVQRLNGAVAAVVKDPEVKARMVAVGVDPAEDTSSEYLDRTIRSDLAFWKQFMADTGIRLE
ncbi:tripartite tricarboxylate transporter substrate binding protein [Verticiella sediminum]|uniref:Tripartite tricarboxylate transporter substrate binding protein n=1 Tax=Verticiella sediminum TaxID=1247510 RepID=A0A556AJJ3_9BURK|nr:tripartite tricarboxylate transporter substrate binding protein [Verticiella sediminum]TSH93043.1 tripartite tricarboxylate transporter substrate binding protein [Verticiella sediminum]